MSLIASVIGTAERVPLPDFVIRSVRGGKEWRWSGEHYQRTALDRLANFDSHSSEIETILRKVYGDDTALWMRRGRWFFLATSGLFGFAGGSNWGVSHSG